MIERISAITRGTQESPRAVQLFRALGFEDPAWRRKVVIHQLSRRGGLSQPHRRAHNPPPLLS
jgi:hypothetical protein